LNKRAFHTILAQRAWLAPPKERDENG